MFEMLSCAVDLIGKQRAAGAAFLPIWAKHEVIDDQLTTPVEQVGEREAAIGALEQIVLLNRDPGQRAAHFG